MFWKSKYVAELEQKLAEVEHRIATQEDYHGIKYYKGDHNRPHYRKIRKDHQ